MTDLQRIYPLAIIIILIIAFGFVAGCTDSSPHLGAAASATVPTTSANSTVERVEVFHFHGNSQCTSCIAVGDLAEKTVNNNFKAELASGRLVFAHINYDLPENAALAAKYGVTGSSLWIGIYDNNGFHKQQDMDVWYLTGEKEKYNFYLTALISKRLNGDLS
ncbi:MAG: nitrophenyl compound nitroreductase subunit ArsF family protein [Methanomicrobiales archaeon]